ncbi:MAG: hypothetical protein D3925_02230 [Candidatus Electrothrix sp. AR5]|nr:hypothetical protein [Candidatus Electrothrix sp. AR5]
MLNKKNNDYLESKNFEDLSFHDNYVYGFFVRKKEFGEDLIIDIDFISEWICHKDKPFSFKIVPANLIFFDLVDFEINLSWGKSLSQPDPKFAITHMPSGELILNGIKKETFKDPIYNNEKHKFHKYIFDFITPEKGILNLGATKVRLIGRKGPVESTKQHLDWSMRPGLFET